MQIFTKKDPRPSRISHEVRGLMWLADTPDEAAQVVPVLDSGSTWLTEPRLHRVSPTASAAEEFGRALAHTHAAGAPHFGAPPPGHVGDGWMGEARLPLLHEGAPASWGEFYAQYRILPYIDSPGFTAAQRTALGMLCDRLASGEFDHEQPKLLHEGGLTKDETGEKEGASTRDKTGEKQGPLAGEKKGALAGEKQCTLPEAKKSWGAEPTQASHSPNRTQRACEHMVARTHGDLWNGNVMWTPLGAVLIDPAAQGGHAEEDLAALAVFGFPMLERVLAAYDEVSPLADGWRDRVGLHQLHILSIHVHLFGAAYAPEVMSILQRFV